MKFEKAVRRKAKLRLALSGPSGSGKTLSALLLAQGIGGRIAVIDSERGSASLYAGSVQVGGGRKVITPDFDTLSLQPPFSPENYVEAIKAAESAGYDTAIIDSITHEWSGSGGCMEIAESVAKARFGGNFWSAFSVVTPRHQAFIDAMLQSNMHIIVTMRSKTETAQQEGKNGKKSVVKLGMKAEQRDGFEYEMTAVLDLSHEDHFATSTKDRTGIFMGRDPVVITSDTGKHLLAWLESGEDEPEPEKPVEMADEAVQAHIKAMTGADSVEALQAAWVAASEAATDAKDKAAYRRFVGCANARKAALAGEEEKSA